MSWVRVMLMGPIL
ncbi:hypothetical protein, partial [Plasmodium yoelii yoelii]